MTAWYRGKKSRSRYPFSPTDWLWCLTEDESRRRSSNNKRIVTVRHYYQQGGSFIFSMMRVFIPLLVVLTIFLVDLASGRQHWNHSHTRSLAHIFRSKSTRASRDSSASISDRIWFKKGQDQIWTIFCTFERHETLPGIVNRITMSWLFSNVDSSWTRILRWNGSGLQQSNVASPYVSDEYGSRVESMSRTRVRPFLCNRRRENNR